MKNIIILFIHFLLVCCSNSAKTKLGLKTHGPDQTTVSAHEYLKIPPILTELPEPQEFKG
ncbi:MAG: hypothetical protein MTP17_03515 [Candidatus Midichloria sp.]|nr:MAG: hypothetical protein MTP17_03515 [Candidatus Midichloria sp.]